MNQHLNRNLFFIKEHTGIFKAANNFDIFNPENGEKIMECREPNLGIFTKIFRFTEYKRLTPFNIEIKDANGNMVASIKRGFNIWLSKVEVFDENEVLVGFFKQKLFTIGGAFSVNDANGTELCMLKGKWTGWDFKFIQNNNELAYVTKKWAGMGKELFTSADNYVLNITEQVPQNDPLRILVLSAVMCIDMVLKE